MIEEIFRNRLSRKKKYLINFAKKISNKISRNFKISTYVVAIKLF
jgi:hypothetical protein